MQSVEIKELATALAKAQGQMGSALKDASNPFFKSKYADLTSVIEAVKKPLSDNALSYVQLIVSENTDTFVETVLMHSSGQWVSSKMKVKPTKEDMQGLGSAITYARRYSLQSVCGISAEDDDGEAAVGRNAEHTALLREVEEVASLVFKKKRLALATWLGTNYQRNSLEHLTLDELKKCKTTFFDAKDNNIDMSKPPEGD